MGDEQSIEQMYEILLFEEHQKLTDPKGYANDQQTDSLLDRLAGAKSFEEELQQHPHRPKTAVGDLELKRTVIERQITLYQRETANPTLCDSCIHFMPDQMLEKTPPTKAKDYHGIPQYEPGIICAIGAIPPENMFDLPTACGLYEEMRPGILLERKKENADQLAVWLEIAKRYDVQA